MDTKTNVTSLPSRVMGVPARRSANFLQVLRGRLKLWSGLAAEWIGLPGFIQDSDIRDRLTGQNIRVRVRKLIHGTLREWSATISSSRFTGRFDGTGSGRG